MSLVQIQCTFSIDDPFLFMLTVPPAKPVISVSELFNTVSWSLPQGINNDERADLFTVSLNFTNRTIAQELALVGDADGAAELGVVPGWGTLWQVTAHNQDGSTVSDVQEFTTPPGRYDNLRFS